MTMTPEQDAFGKALVEWLDSQEVALNVSIPVMIGLCGIALGESASDRGQLLHIIDLHEKLLVTAATNAYKDANQ